MCKFFGVSRRSIGMKTCSTGTSTQTGQGVLYLSMIRDLYDNSIVAYKTAASQTISLVLDTIRLAVKQEKRRSLGDCSSTVTKASSTPHKHTSTWLKNTALHPLCQDEETVMIMPWLKISFPSLNQSVSTAKKSRLSSRLTNLLTISFISTTMSASS